MAREKPTADQMHVAADWLDAYDNAADAPDEDDGSDKAACVAVASWLRSQGERSERGSLRKEAEAQVIAAGIPAQHRAEAIKRVLAAMKREAKKHGRY